jgi:hypothetical protein
MRIVELRQRGFHLDGLPDDTARHVETLCGGLADALTDAVLQRSAPVARLLC